MKVRDVMTKKPFVLRPNDKLKNVIKTIADNRISGCPIVSNGRLIGLVTQTDILKTIDVHSSVQRPGNDMFSLVLAVIKSERYDDLKGTIKRVLDMNVREFMNKDVVTIAADEDLYAAARLMNKNDIDGLPVTDGDKLVGIITRWDIVRVMEKLG